MVLAALVLVCPDPTPAVPAEDGALRQAVRAQVLAVELGPFRQGVFPLTLGTGEGFSHSHILPIEKDSRRIIPRPHSYDI